MKRNTKISVMLSVALIVVLTCSSAMAASVGMVRTLDKSGTVNLRLSPNGQITGSANNGDLLSILKKSGTWSRVSMTSGVMKGRSGWMFNEYVLNLKNISNISGWGALAHIKTEYATSNVNLRKGPGMSYGVKDTLQRDDMLIILDKYNSSWYEVQVARSNRTGYVSSQYIANGVTGVTTANVNLRSKASSSSRVLDVIPSGEKITVLNVGTSWAKVRYDGTTGYIFTKYLRLM